METAVVVGTVGHVWDHFHRNFYSDNRNWYAALTFRLSWDRSGRDPEAILPEQLYSEDISIDIHHVIDR
jgi:hypothetical protein